MNSKNLVFSHQRETVLALSSVFDAIQVFTCEGSNEPLPGNVKVNLVKWKVGSPIVNILNIVFHVYPFLIKDRKVTVFTHMVDVHAAIISPLTWILRIRHVLWYAHATNSLPLKFSSFFVSQIVSSTRGSCNLNFNKRKVKFINQGIDKVQFSFDAKRHNHLKRFLYYGRLDPSKNIHLFIPLMSQINSIHGFVTIDIYGEVLNPKATTYLTSLKLKVKEKGFDSIINFHGKIERLSVPYIAKDYDVFLNLFTGSLDKTLIEATLMGLPVITWNLEYCNIFGTWSNAQASERLDFVFAEIKALKTLKYPDLKKELNRRHRLATKEHDFNGWIMRLTSILKQNYK
jgi:glycosyltransferase involved in cell wall biosynthesis